MRRALIILLTLALCLTLSGCRREPDPLEEAPNPIATITMADGSVMHFELQLRIARNTVLNFTKLANDGFYDGLEFFRVVPGVLIQAGDPNNDGTGDAGYAIKGEFSNNGVQNDLSHNRGTLSMARRMSDANSASSQFFIMQGNYPEYDGDFAAFGVAADPETLTAVDAIATQPVDGYYVPLKHFVIQSIRVNTHGYEYPDPETIPID